MPPVIDLDRARRATAGRRARSERELAAVLDDAYDRLGPVLPRLTMSDGLRAWLRRWALQHDVGSDDIKWFASDHEAGLSITLKAVGDDPDLEQLLAPELLLALLAVDQHPDVIRRCWPADRDPAELVALADAFARPYSR